MNGLGNFSNLSDGVLIGSTYGMKPSFKTISIKLDEELSAEIKRAKPEGMSIAAYVRNELKKSLNASMLRKSAGMYLSMTKSDNIEMVWLKEWGATDLVSPPRLKNKGRIHHG